ncbi:hypothetical protein CC85DRAFT_325279 [Cutaneotrichosporon oleaginosum]|uniref:Uncharacterized protein n=1 Tax=Cutaneotrichosporon oleaginosum TaxID=879819 RepID=A0A0J0XYB3_9TREE|nr:uncharacterized protein CC85DRAFT_325279 [Cutaneotrichosporon oleaginosum]KLT46026.1 hypothetical protein CC85DRAFT_325279 [Cutaneotrichosporon oleaginosum]TXT06720.1 hypothetical protein COLE_06051 [Cutaneotrichosporon oleaginosum]
MALLRAPLPAPLARQRLKGNLAGLALLIFARSVFTPYLALRGLLVSILDALGAPADTVWWLETAATALLCWNIFEAAYRVQHPSPAPPTPAGMKLVPVLQSSPLTRSYEPAATYTPTRTATQSPLAQSLYKSTPGRHSPTRSSPLSSSTARVLNLQQSGTATSTGLFYDDNTPASPSKVARPNQETPTKPRERATYTVVDREEREWVENVWKGVKGKSHRLGL